jgi:hypothetical protein
MTDKNTESEGQTWWLHIDGEGRIVSTAATRGALRVLKPREEEGERVIEVSEVSHAESKSIAHQTVFVVADNNFVSAESLAEPFTSMLGAMRERDELEQAAPERDYRVIAVQRASDTEYQSKDVPPALPEDGDWSALPVLTRDGIDRATGHQSVSFADVKQIDGLIATVGDDPMLCSDKDFQACGGRVEGGHGVTGRQAAVVAVESALGGLLSESKGTESGSHAEVDDDDDEGWPDLDHLERELIAGRPVSTAVLLVVIERARSKAMECRSVALTVPDIERIVAWASLWRGYHDPPWSPEDDDLFSRLQAIAYGETEQESVVDDSDLIDEDPWPPPGRSPYAPVHVDHHPIRADGHDGEVLVQTAPGRLFQWHTVREAWSHWHGWATEEKSKDQGGDDA